MISWRHIVYYIYCRPLFPADVYMWVTVTNKIHGPWTLRTMTIPHYKHTFCIAVFKGGSAITKSRQRQSAVLTPSPAVILLVLSPWTFLTRILSTGRIGTRTTQNFKRASQYYIWIIYHCTLNVKREGLRYNLTRTLAGALCSSDASAWKVGWTCFTFCLSLRVLIGPWATQLASIATLVVKGPNTTIHCWGMNWSLNKQNTRDY